MQTVRQSVIVRSCSHQAKGEKVAGSGWILWAEEVGFWNNALIIVGLDPTYGSTLSPICFCCVCLDDRNFQLGLCYF